MKDVASGTERKLSLPAAGSFSPRRSRRTARRSRSRYTTDNGIKLVVADVATAAVSPVLDGGINGLGGGCSWLDDSSGFLCALIPAGRGAPPAEPTVPTGPTIQENMGRSRAGRARMKTCSRARTTRRCTTTTSRASSRGWTLDGQEDADRQARDLQRRMQISTDGNWLLVSHVKRPFSYVVPASQFPREVEIWDETGKLVEDARRRADGRHGPAATACSPGPRGFRWHPIEPATLIWTRGARQGRSAEQGPVPRSRRRAQGAVHRPAGRVVQDGMALRPA